MDKIKNIQDIIESISLTDGTQYMALRIFDRTPLRDTSYIKISTIDELLRFNSTASKPTLYYWDEYTKDDGTTGKRMIKRDSDERLTILDLLESCEELKYYVEKYFPQYTI